MCQGMSYSRDDASVFNGKPGAIERGVGGMEYMRKSIGKLFYRHDARSGISVKFIREVSTRGGESD